jgi:DNA mismatch repair ATPase MutS
MKFTIELNDKEIEYYRQFGQNIDRMLENDGWTEIAILREAVRFITNALGKREERMTEYYQQAQQLVQRVIEDLQRLLPRDGEDISCYNPCAVDTSILGLVKVRTLLGRADEAEKRDRIGRVK